MTHDTLHLLFGADWAIAHADAHGLADITRKLAEHVSDPLRIELIELSQVCRLDFARAARRWPLIREQFATLE